MRNNFIVQQRKTCQVSLNDKTGGILPSQFFLIITAYRRLRGQEFFNLEYYNLQTHFAPLLDFISEGRQFFPSRPATNKICAPRRAVRLNALLHQCLLRYEVDATMRLTRPIGHSCYSRVTYKVAFISYLLQALIQ